MFKLLPLLAAKWELWVYGILGLLSVLGWIIRQVNQAQQKKELERRRAQAPPPRPQQPAAQQPQRPPMRPTQEVARPQAPPPRPQGMPVAQRPAAAPPPRQEPPPSPLETFLREMARHLEPSAPAPAPAAPPPPPRPKAAQRRREQQKLDESELAPEDRGRSVSEHVQKYMDSSEFQQRKRELAKGVRAEVETLRAEIERKFDHQVGSLDVPDAPPAEYQVQRATITPIAREIRAIISNPKQIRSAIILNEILQRPKFRS